MLNNMDSSKLKILTHFRNQMVNFLDELIDQFPSEGDFVVIRIFLKDKIPVQDIMDNFIKNVLPHKERIQKKDEKFFVEGGANLYNNVYKSYGKQKVDLFKKLWQSKQLDKEDRIIIWKWINLFVLLCEKYQKCK